MVTTDKQTDEAATSGTTTNQTRRTGAVSAVPPPSRRGRAVDRRIERATLEMLQAHGPMAVNIEAVAAHSGVAKTTIYRRYRDRRALLGAAIRSASVAIPVPSDLPTYDTLRLLLGQASQFVEHIVGRGTIAALVADQDPEFTALLREMMMTRAGSLAGLVRERIEAGDLRADLDVGLVATLVLGSALGQLVRGGELDEQWSDSMVRFIWPAIAA